MVQLRMKRSEETISHQVRQVDLNHQQPINESLRNYDTYKTGRIEGDKPPQLFDFECFTSQSMTESMLVEFLQEIMKQHTSLSSIDLSPLQGTIIKF